MAQKRHSVDQIVAKLRKADVELGKGKKVPEVCKLLMAVEKCGAWRLNSAALGVKKHEGIERYWF